MLYFCDRHGCGCNCRRRYGFWNFLGDLFLICLTGGLWIFGIIIREVRNR